PESRAQYMHQPPDRDHYGKGYYPPDHELPTLRPFGFFVCIDYKEIDSPPDKHNRSNSKKKRNYRASDKTGKVIKNICYFRRVADPTAARSRSRHCYRKLGKI